MNDFSDYTLYHPFQKMYWQKAAHKLKETKSIVLASILIAMMIVVNVFGVMLNIEVLGRKVYFEFIPASICSLLLGPVIGVMSGAISDILGFIIAPGGYPFFFGYTISAMLSSLIYAIFLYSARISIIRISCAKLLVNIVVNVFLGTLWQVMMMGNYSLYWYFLGLSITKNLSLLPFEIAVLALMFKYLIPISKSFQIISPAIPNEITFFK